MKKTDIKQQESKLIVRLSKDLHMEAKALSAYKGVSLQHYVTTALLNKVLTDKKYIKPQVE